MKNVMIDIETLSTRSDAAVLSIGLAAFDDQGVTDTCEILIDPKQVFGHIDVGTVSWWMKQSDAARQATFSGGTPQFHAASLMGTFFAHHFDTAAGEVWANGPQFDLEILQHWIDGLIERSYVPRGSKLPWRYNQARDYRTFMAEWRRLGVPVNDVVGPRSGTAHSAVDDAAGQARDVIAVRKWLQNRVITGTAAGPEANGAQSAFYQPAVVQP